MHLLRGDVVVEQRLPVLQGRRVGKASDEVGVRVRVGRVGGQVAGQVVGCCSATREREGQEIKPIIDFIINRWLIGIID